MSADADPHYQKLYGRVTDVCSNRRGQPSPSAMKEPRPGRNPFYGCVFTRKIFTMFSNNLNDKISPIVPSVGRLLVVRPLVIYKVDYEIFTIGLVCAII